MPGMINTLPGQYVEEVKKIYGDRLKSVILYGSYARGDFGPDSDIDIMILVDLADAEIEKYSKLLSWLTYDFNEEHGTDIKPVAKSALQSARILLREGEYRGANFNRDYVRTEIFPKTFGRRIARAEEIRHASDCDDFYIATKEKAQEQILTAQELIEQTKLYYLNRLKE